MKESGILMPIFSLPSKYGIGCFSNEAYKFIDFLAKAEQRYWQILPLVPIDDTYSPYQSCSTFAGNYLFIDLEQLVYDELLTKEEIESFDWTNDNKINYEQVKHNKKELLKKAYDKFWLYCDKDMNLYFSYLDFLEHNDAWIVPYTNYMHRKTNMPRTYYAFEQYIFDKQWNNLKTYANSIGIKIIGDLPIYISADSADAEYNKKLFQIENGKLSYVAGCPGDNFAPDGQFWGNPLYNWNKHKETNYSWWKERIKRCFELYDVLRLDHFKGFDEYFAIPYNGKPNDGHWEKAPGIEFFNVLKEEFGDLEIIAEDLGVASESLDKLLHDTGFPGMKVLQFAFNGGKDNPYLPENINENSIVYTGTHDNNTTIGWYNKATDWEKEQLKQYIPEITDISWNLIELAMSTKAKICIVQMQDYLSLDENARINTPGTVGSNWTWRIDEIPSDDIVDKIKNLVKKYNR